MHCNQPFCINPNNVFNNGYGYIYNPYNPPPINSGFYPPSIVGEGDVSCVTLPDGTCQFYFTPAANWCAPNNHPCHNMINTNHVNPYWNPNTGTWFVRSITSPTPALWNNSPHLHYEAPISFRPLDCSMTAINNGFQLKFHNDKWTSTADIHYFYPCLREIDYTPTVTFPTRGCAGVQVNSPMVPNTMCPLPTRGCAGVQVDTPMAPNTMCHYEVICPKPCHCISCPTQNTKPTEVVDCQCSSSSKQKKPLAINSAQRLQLLPGDKRKKRIRFEKKIKKSVKSKSNDVICECSPPPKLEKVTQKDIEKKPKDVICACNSPPSLEKLALHVIESEPCDCSPCSSSENISSNDTESKSKDVVCECSPPLSMDKSAATHDINETNSRSKTVQSPCSWMKEKSKKVQSPCCWEEKPILRGDAFVKRKSESWCPLTESIKKVFSLNKRESETTCCSGYCNSS